MRYRIHNIVVIAFMSITALNNVTSLESGCDIHIHKGKVPKYFIKDETFSMSCRVRCTNVSVADIFWKTPGYNGSENIYIESNDEKVGDSILKYSKFTIYNASKEDEGEYICFYNSSNGLKGSKPFNKTLVKPFLIIDRKPQLNSLSPSKVIQLSHSEIITYEAYPPIANWSLLKNGNEIPVGNNEKKYGVNVFPDYINVWIRNLTLEDTANYTLVLRSASCAESYTYEVRPLTHPEVKLIPERVKTMKNSKISLMCVVTGSPLPPVKWYYPEKSLIDIIEKKVTNALLYNQTLVLQATILNSSNITCKAGDVKTMVTVLVYEVPDGFSITNSSKIWYPENYNVTKECVASKNDFEKLVWISADNNDLVNLSEYSESALSHVLKLNLEYIKPNQSGIYQCIGYRKNHLLDTRKISITVAKTELPYIVGEKYQDLIVPQYKTVLMSCCAHAVPPPIIEWRKDNNILINKTNVKITMKSINETTINSTVEIIQAQNEESGKYVCIATSGKFNVEKVYNLSLKGNGAVWIIAEVALTIIIILVAIVLYLYRKKKYYEKMFEEGCIEKLDPKLPINDQANLLPYNKEYEIPENTITLEKLLGCGEFGEVHKATAFIKPGILTTVAVKKAKKHANKTFVEALASELKILQHIGKHNNIINLLGACTKNYIKGELLVIVEYCEFGNLNSYLVNHRAIFVDHFIHHVYKESGCVNEGFNYNNYVSRGKPWDCNCDPLLSKSIESNTELRLKDTASNYIPQSALKNSISDTSALCTQDLLYWAFQIALGMEHLVRRRVLHGDLATRNILLTQGNVVKICDFGLSRKLYGKAYCSKDADCPLPIKWLAIECLTDLIFSTQSDIWAFGVVLWELFSLGRTPYPDKDISLLDYLLQGKRMSAPTYADDHLYRIMLRCWYKEPNKRPSFTQLREKLFHFLNENNRQKYMDMAPIKVNCKEDNGYVSMMCKPDFDNMSCRDPHTYVVASHLTSKNGMWEMKCIKNDRKNLD